MNLAVRSFFTILLAGLSTLSFAQVTEAEEDLKTQSADTTDGWDYGGVINIGMSQTSLTNWAAGGQNSVAVNGLLSLFAHYKKGPNMWENYLDVGYGTIQQGRNAPWWKTDDKIELTSKYGRKAFSDFYYAGLLNFRTQMAPGYNYPDDSTKISDLLAPAYLLLAAGLDYKPSDNFTLFVAPVTGKITIVNDQGLADLGAFGVTPAVYDAAGNLVTAGENVRYEFGGYLRMFYKRDIIENIGFQTRLDLFSNYLHNPQNIDVNWETLISMKVNKFISANLATTLIYDDDINIGEDTDGDDVPDRFGPRVQFKEIFSVGFSYKF